jgi:hypothetical protein
MKRPCPLLRLLFIAAFLSSAMAASVKLAIVQTSPEVADPAALLTAALSKHSSIALLERESLDKILRERGLAANQLTNFLSASRIAGAQAVLFVEPTGPRTNLALNLRLVAVKEGAVLFAARSALAIENTERWAEKTSASIASIAAKLALDRTQLIPITVLNLRSPTSVSASELLDRELTSLLLLRLARETNILLLERRKLLDISLEKDFAADSKQFWSGAWLLDGTVNKEGFHPDKTTVSFRLISPDKTVAEFEVTGPRTNVAAIIERAVLRLAESLKINKSTSWNPTREAREHAEEAIWALRWKMYPEAQAAADSAIALGLHTREVSVVRALAYGRDRAEWDPRFTSGGFFNVYSPSHPPLPERGETVFRSMAILDELLAREPDAIADKAVLAAAVEMLDTSGSLLMAYYSMVEARAGREAQLAEWRRLCRTVQTVALKNPSVREPFVDPFRAGKVQYELRLQFTQTNLFKTVATHTGIFSETPEEALPVYRDLVAQPGIPFIREMFTRRFSYPIPRPVGGWKWADRKRDVAVWDSFVHELCSSTNVFVQLEGRSLELRDETDWHTYKARYAKLLEFLEQHWPQIDPRKNQLLLTDVVSANFHADGFNQAQEKEEEELSPVGYQFLADRGVVVGNINGRKYEAKTPLPIVSSTSRPTPKFSESFRGPSLKPQFVEIAPYGGKLRPPPLQAQIYRDGKFWFQYRGATRPPYDHGSEIFSVDLKSHAIDRTPLHTNYFRRPVWLRPWIQDSERLAKSFEVRSNELFVVEGGSLLRGAVSHPKWSSHPIPVKDPDIYQFNGRLYLSASDSIYEVEENGNSRLLASARRRPAATTLDQLDDFNFAALSRGPTGAIRAFVNGNGYQSDGRNWAALTTFSNLQCKVTDDGAFFTTLNSPPFVQLHALHSTQSTPQYLAVGAHSKTDASLYTGQTNRWVVAADDLRGGHFFAGAIPAVFCRRPATDPLKYQLLLFPPNAKGPATIALEFDEKPEKGLAEAFYSGFRLPWALNTPDGLVLGHPLLPGFWVISKRELDDAVTAAGRIASEGFQSSSAK